MIPFLLSQLWNPWEQLPRMHRFILPNSPYWEEMMNSIPLVYYESRTGPRLLQWVNPSLRKAFAFVPESTSFHPTQLLSFRVLDEHSAGYTLNYYLSIVKPMSWIDSIWIQDALNKHVQSKLGHSWCNKFNSGQAKKINTFTSVRC